MSHGTMEANGQGAIEGGRDACSVTIKWPLFSRLSHF